MEIIEIIFFVILLTNTLLIANCLFFICHLQKEINIIKKQRITTRNNNNNNNVKKRTYFKSSNYRKNGVVRLKQYENKPGRKPALEKIHIDDLRKIASQRGIKQYSNYRKAELIQKIKETY